MKKIIIFASLVLFSTFSLCLANTQYTVTDLGAFKDISNATAINNNGQVAGFCMNLSDWSDRHAFMWDPSTGMHDLGAFSDPYEDYSYAYGINNHGQVVGVSRISSSSSDWNYHGFLWDMDNGLQDLGTYNGSSFARSINDHQQIAGYKGGSESLMWTPEHGWQSLGIGGYNYCEGINDHGQIVGSMSTSVGRHAFLWDSEEGVRDLGDLPGGQNTSYGVQINNSGQVIGNSYSEIDYNAFIWDSENGMINLGHLGGGYSQAEDLNEHGVVVGNSNGNGFIWDPENGMQNLNYFLASSAQGWRISGATGINDHGQIVGYGTSPEGNYHAFLMTPAVPEPATLVLFTLGGLSLFRRRK